MNDTDLLPESSINLQANVADVVSKRQEGGVSSSIQDPCIKSRTSDDNDLQNANPTIARQKRSNRKEKLTYVEVLKSPSNANISSQLISKSSDNPKENRDEMLIMLSNTSTNGFVGVQRKREKFKSFLCLVFLSM